MVKGFIFEVVYMCIDVDLHNGNEFFMSIYRHFNLDKKIYLTLIKQCVFNKHSKVKT